MAPNHLMDWELLRYTDRLSVPPLVEALFAVLLATPGRPLPARTREVLEAADDAAYAAALAELEPHKVFPLLDHQLAQLGLDGLVPAPSRERIAETHRRVRALNMMHVLAAAAALKAAGEVGEPLLVMKGLLFADSYYPAFSTRPMGDVDLVALPGRGDALFALLERAGFRRVEVDMPQDHAALYVGPQGTKCDAHRGLPMFDGQDLSALTRPHELNLVRGVRVLCFEPNAMLAHLVTHCHGHQRDLGFVLLWLIDVAIVLRRHGAEIDPDRVRAILLSGEERARGAASTGAARYGLFLRILGLLRGAGEALGPALAERALSVPPLTLGEVLRQRRITPWKLPAPRGWLRLAVHVLDLRENTYRPEVEPLDLLLWPLDRLNMRLARRFAR
jgi:hypothetical protein